MIVAIDPSLSNTAVIVGDADRYRLGTFGSKHSGSDVTARISRFEDLVARIMGFIERDAEIDAVYLEGYSYGSNDNGARSLAEFGGVLRWNLIDVSKCIIEVPPTTLKKFATGKGNSRKEIVASHLTKRYGVTFDNSDSYDAFALYRLGMCVQGWVEPANHAQRETSSLVSSMCGKA